MNKKQSSIIRVLSGLFEYLTGFYQKPTESNRVFVMIPFSGAISHILYSYIVEKNSIGNQSDSFFLMMSSTPLFLFILGWSFFSGRLNTAIVFRFVFVSAWTFAVYFLLFRGLNLINLISENTFLVVVSYFIIVLSFCTKFPTFFYMLTGMKIEEASKEFKEWKKDYERRKNNIQINKEALL